MNHQEIQSALWEILQGRDFEQTSAQGPDRSAMGGWLTEFQSDEFIAQVSQDRTGDVVSICIGSNIRPKTGAHMRGPWSLSHLRGYLDGQLDHFRFENPDEQLTWLRNNLNVILDSDLLNSDELNAWAVKASRRMLP